MPFQQTCLEVMALSSEEGSAIRDDLVTLHQAASSIDGWDGRQSRTFIEVGEYGLALDELAYAYLDSGKNMTAGLFKTFERLAAIMELEGDAEYGGVARLRAGARGRPA